MKSNFVCECEAPFETAEQFSNHVHEDCPTRKLPRVKKQAGTKREAPAVHVPIQHRSTSR